MDYQFQFNVIWQNWDLFLKGVWLTIRITSIATVLGLILGMIMAGVLGIECVSIYHTDFAAQAEYIFKDEGLAGFIQSFINRFYAFSTHIKVPTQEYIDILARQNYHVEKMSIFKRGYTPQEMNTSDSWRAAFEKENHIKPGFTLMWAGRVSKDKNIEFLIDVYKKTLAQIPDLNLVICGDGPDLEDFKTVCSGYDRIHMIGYVENDKLQDYYQMSDMFVFPSTTDTFGMVILEAQAKGLFSLVTDVGGPQEIIENHKTGQVLSLSNLNAWVEKIKDIYTMKAETPDEFIRMRHACHEQILRKFNWDDALMDILGEQEETALLAGNDLNSHEPEAFNVEEAKKVVA